MTTKEKASLCKEAADYFKMIATSLDTEQDQDDEQSSLHFAESGFFKKKITSIQQQYIFFCSFY